MRFTAIAFILAGFVSPAFADVSPIEKLMIKAKAAVEKTAPTHTCDAKGAPCIVDSPENCCSRACNNDGTCL